MDWRTIHVDRKRVGSDLKTIGMDRGKIDIDPKRIEALKSRGIKVVSPDAALTTECDVLAPCATGGILNARSIPQLRCRVIAGGANNQLEQPSDADLLFERGIVYAPDFVINAGGVLHGGGLEEQGWTRAMLDERLAGIGAAVYDILRHATQKGISTDTAARQIAKSRIEAVS